MLGLACRHCLGAARATGLLDTACPYTLTAVRAGQGAADASVSVDIVGEQSGETTTISAGSFINCAGPFALGVNDLMPGVGEYPFEHELHAKVVMNDTMGVRRPKEQGRRITNKAWVVA